MTHSDGPGSQARKPPKNWVRAQFWNPYTARHPKPSGADFTRRGAAPNPSDGVVSRARDGVCSAWGERT